MVVMFSMKISKKWILAQSTLYFFLKSLYFYEFSKKKSTLPFIQEERMRGYSLKNKQREANLLLIEKKKKRFSCEDPAENAFESSKLV